MEKQMNLTTHGSMFPAIPEDRLDAVIGLSEDQTMWLKLVEGGLKVVAQDKFIKNVTGAIIDVTPYLMKFENGVPSKIPHVADDLQIPAGYERRCDVKIAADGQVFGLSLAPSSTRFYLSPYLKFLRSRGLRPEEAVTRVSSKQASNDRGTWSVAVFELIDTPEGEAPSEHQSKGARNIPDEWS